MHFDKANRSLDIIYTEAKLRFSSTSEKTTKKQLYKVKKKRKKLWLCVGFKPATSRIFVHVFHSQSRMHSANTSQNKAENRYYEVSNITDRDYSKRVIKFICELGSKTKLNHTNT